METLQHPHQAPALFTLPETDKPVKEATIKLTTEQIEFYKKNGFLSIDNLVDEKEVVCIREQYDKWFAAKIGREHGNFFDLLSEDIDDQEAVAPQLLWPSIYGKIMTGFNLYDTQMYANAYAVCKALLGDDVKFKGDHAIMKPASVNSLETPWHQDEAYWNPKLSYESIGVWVPLQPATVESGCMQFVPDTHTILDVLPHHTPENNPRIHGLELDNVDAYVKDVVSCPLPIGGATFHHCRTIHYTGPNRSNQPRRAYTLQFELEPKERAQPRPNMWNEMKTTARERRMKESGWTLRAP